MIQLWAALAAAAIAAGPSTSVFEVSIHVLREGEGQKIHDDIETKLQKAGGVEVSTGRHDMIAFTFGEGRVADLRKKLQRGMDALGGVGVMRGKSERLVPTEAERKEQAQKEIAGLAQERKEIATALQKAPLINAYLDLKVSELEKLDPSLETRRGVLLVILDGSSPPEKPKDDAKGGKKSSP